MSRASSRDSRLSSNEGDRTASRGDGRPEVGWGAPVYPAAGPRGVKRPRSASPAPVAVDVPEGVQHRHHPSRSRRTSASAQATSPNHASGRRRSWVHRRGPSYASMREGESAESVVLYESTTDDGEHARMAQQHKGKRRAGPQAMQALYALPSSPNAREAPLPSLSAVTHQRDTDRFAPSTSNPRAAPIQSRVSVAPINHVGVPSDSIEAVQDALRATKEAIRAAEQLDSHQAYRKLPQAMPSERTRTHVGQPGRQPQQVSRRPGSRDHTLTSSAAEAYVSRPAGRTSRPRTREGPNSRPSTGERNHPRPTLRDARTFTREGRISRPTTGDRPPAREPPLRLAPDSPPARFVVDESVLAAGGRVGAGVHISTSRPPAVHGTSAPQTVARHQISAQDTPYSPRPAPSAPGPAHSRSRHHAGVSGPAARRESRGSARGKAPAPHREGARPLSREQALVTSTARDAAWGQPIVHPQQVQHSEQRPPPPHDRRPQHSSKAPSHPHQAKPSWPPHPPPQSYPPYAQDDPPPVLPPSAYGPEMQGVPSLHVQRRGPPQYAADIWPPPPAHPAAFREVHRADDFRALERSIPPVSDLRYQDAPLPSMKHDGFVVDDPSPSDEGLASGPHPSGPPTEEEMSRRAHDLLAGLTQEREGRRREVRTGAVGARGRTNAHLHAPQSWLPLHDGALPHAREEIERRREEVLDAHHRAHDEAQRREAEQQRERQSMMEMDRRRQEDIKRRQEETDRHRQGPSPDDARYPTASASSHLPHRPAAVSGVEAQRKRDAMRQANLRQAACRGGKEARRKWAEEKRQKEERSQRLLAEHLARMEEEARQRRALDAEQQRLQAQDRLRQAELDAANAQGRLQNGSSDPLGDALAAAARLADRMQAGELAFRSGPTNITVETQQQAAAHFIPPRGERLDDAPGPVKARRKTGTKRRARGNTKATETSSSAAADWTDAPVWFVPTAGFVKRPPPSDLVESVREKRTTTPLSRTPVPHLEPATWPIFDILDSTAPVDLAEDAVIATSANEPHHDPTAPSYPSAGQSYPPTDCATTSLLPGALNPGLRGEASQDDVVPSLVPVSQRAYVVPAEYSIEHTFAARLRACPVCEEKEDCEDEGHVEAECVHGKKFEKCKRCIELGLDGKARWKTRCVAQEGVVRHRVWSRSSLSEGVREQVIAAAADEASEDEACELGCSEEHPLKQDVGVGPPMANPVIEDPQTMHPLEDSNSDEDIQITGHVLPRSASPPVTAFNDAFAPLHSAISIARRYLPTDCTLAMQDGTLIPVPRASLSGSVLVVPSPNLPAFAPSDPSHGDLQAQIELTDERSAKRSRKRSRGSAAPASSLQAKRARSRSPTSQIAANDGDDTAAAQALMLLFSSNAPSDPAAQPSAEDSAFASTALRSTADEATETGDDVTITPSDEDRDPVTIAKDEVVGPATAPSLVDAGVCEPPRADIEWTVDVHVNASAISETDRCADEPLRIAVDATTDTAPTKVDEGTSVDSQARVLRLLRWARSVTAEQRRICLPQPDIESHLMETLPDLPPPTSHSPEAADILSEGRDTYEEAKPHEHDALLASIATEEALAGPAPAKESAPGIIAEERKSERKSTDSIEDELSMTTAVPIASNSPAAEPARGQTCAAHDVCDPQPALICAPTSAEAVAEELFPEECPSVVEPEASSLSSAPAESEERPCTRVLPTPRVELPDSPISPQDPLSAIALTPTDDRLGHLGAIATTKAPTATEATVKISPPAGVPEPSSTPLTDNERPPPQATGFAGSLENGYARACATGCPPNDQRLVKQDGMILPAGELQPPRLRLSLREHLALKRKREAEEAERDGKRARADSPPSAPPLIPVALMTGGGSRPRNSRSPPPQRLYVATTSAHTSAEARPASGQTTDPSAAYRNVIGSFCM